MRLSCLPSILPRPMLTSETVPPEVCPLLSLQPGALAWGGPCTRRQQRLGSAHLSLGGSPEVGLTELHGLLQRGLLVHLSKETLKVKGPGHGGWPRPGAWSVRTSSSEDPPTLPAWLGSTGGSTYPSPGSIPQGHYSGPGWSCGDHVWDRVILRPQGLRLAASEPDPAPQVSGMQGLLESEAWVEGGLTDPGTKSPRHRGMATRPGRHRAALVEQRAGREGDRLGQQE